MSGHGLQIIIGITEPIKTKTYFKEKRKEYRACCTKIDEALQQANLPGHADPSVWSPARLLRLPGTANGKEGRPYVDAVLIQGHIEPIKNFLEESRKIDSNVSASEEEGETATVKALDPKMMQHLKADPEGIATCQVLEAMKENPNDVPEPVWYAALSVLGRVSREMAHEYSKGYKDYVEEETDGKIDQALEASGPVTCEHFNLLWDKCKTCPHLNKVKSPISIKGPNFIRTKDIGFRVLNLRKDPPVQGKPDFDDLYKYFYQVNPYVSLAEYREVYVWDKKRWLIMHLNRLKEFAEIHIDYKPCATERAEFVEKVLANHVVEGKDFLNPFGFVNFLNGTMRLPGSASLKDNNINEMEPYKLYPHREELGMTYLLPFTYDQNADCPRFKLFMREVTMGDDSIIAILQEFMGYALSNADAELGERALFLIGEGSNGKSVFLDVMKWLAGKENFSSVPLNYLDRETARYDLHGKMFNVTEETPKQGLKDSSVFKNLVTGGTMTIKQLYKNPATVKNNAKFIMAANELPNNTDTTRGMFRKILIVPFNASFEGQRIDRRIREKLRDELPGVFNWAVEGYLRLVKNEYHFSASKAVDEEIHSFAYMSDPLKVWANDFLVELDESKAFTTLKELYRSYVFEMDSTHQKPVALTSFSRNLRRLYRYKTYQRRVVDNVKQTCVQGLQLRGRREF
jgi:P4 family phage/plasmid primase-like protien